jgi:hypothetical protein
MAASGFVIVRYREWYGVQAGKPNVGLKLHADVRLARQLAANRSFKDR